MENLFSNCPLPIQIYSKDGSLFYENPSFRNLNASDMNLIDINFNYDTPKVLPIIWLQDRENPIALEPTAFSIPRSNSDLTVIVYKDVTKELETNAELNELKFFFEKAEEIACLGSWNSNMEDEGDLLWSKNTYNVFGCSEKDFDGTVKSFFEKVHPDDRERVREAARRSISTGDVYSIDHRIILPDGKIRWVHEGGKVIPGDGSRPTRFVGITQDITERVEANENLKKLTNRYRAIYESNFCGVFTTEVDGIIRDANTEFLRTTGYTKEDIKSGKLSWREMTPPEMQKQSDRQVQILMETGSCPTFEKEYIRKDGTRCPVLLTATRITHESGENECLAFAFDLTEIKQLQRQLSQVQKLDALGRLVGGVSHDFNNLLNIIMLSLEQLLVVPNDEHVLKKLLSIQEHSQRAKRLIEQLLTFSSSPVRENKFVCIGDILFHMEELIERLMPVTIDVDVKIEDGRTLIRASIAQIEQVIINLVTNARDAMPDGGRLGIEVFLENGFVCLKVSDTGIGMDSQVTNKIFEPFFSTKEFGKGTGLGLATVYGIVQQSGGSIKLDTAPGKGSRFKIFFPIHTEEGPKEFHAIVPKFSADTKTVLVVEDQTELRELIVEILKKNSFNVVEAASGTEGVKKFNSDINLIITDVIMPEMSGPALIKTLSKEVPVLYISGYTNNELERFGVGHNETNLLSKPFNSKELLHKVYEQFSNLGPPA